MSGFQLAGDAPTAYARIAGKIMGQWTDELILAARCEDGDRVLDVACGTGIVAQRVGLVSRKLCSVVGLDINEGMLRIARTTSTIEWHQGSALEMPFEPTSFDAVLCQQGLQFMPDRLAAMQEMARVLAPGGRLSLNVWGALDRQPFHEAVLDEIGNVLGANAKAQLVMAFSLNAVDELRRLASAAGLTNIHVRVAHRTMRHPSPAQLVKGFMLFTPSAAQFSSLPADDRSRFVSNVVAKLADWVDDDGLATSQENRFLTALKPA